MDMLFGTKVYDTKKRQIGILIKTYKLGYEDAPEAMGANILAPDGRPYPQNMDYLIPIDEMDDAEIKEANIPECFLV